MTFAGLSMFDFAAIAHAERLRREHAAAKNRHITDAQRRDDAQRWHMIEYRAQWFREGRRPLPLGDESDNHAPAMAATVMRTTQAALRKWREEGKPGGEPEARAFLLFSLARKFAELVGDPCPYVDGDGAIYFLDQKEQAA